MIEFITNEWVVCFGIIGISTVIITLITLIQYSYKPEIKDLKEKLYQEKINGIKRNIAYETKMYNNGYKEGLMENDKKNYNLGWQQGYRTARTIYVNTPVKHRRSKEAENGN